MKTKTTKNAVSLRTLKGLTGLLLVLFLTGSLHAQIPIQGLAVDHEGVAAWDADGSGPEPAAYGHTHPFGWGSSLYYSASRDYKDIDPDPDAAMCHFLDDITGFPLFVQALADNGFLPGQVKVKHGLLDEKNDIEGEDWFTFNNMHYQNRYDGYYHIELNGELMISGYSNNFNYCISSTGTFFQVKSSFTLPFDASENSSLEVQEVAGAFLDDMDGEQLRFVCDTCPPAGEGFGGNGRINGAYFEIVSGYLEKSQPELPHVGLAADHQGLAGWDADGTGPEPEAYGHTFTYGGTTWETPYYTASRDYDSIDPNPNAALCHITDNTTGFTNLEIQMAYRGFTMDQLKVKAGLSTLGNDEEGIDWGINGSIHWYNHYGTTVTIEIAGEPILEYLIDTNYSGYDMDIPNEDWWSFSTCSPVTDISANASADAQYVAISLLKDIGSQSMKSYMEGHYVGAFSGNGRVGGAFYQLDAGFFTLGEAFGTSVAAGNVSGLWEADKSPYMIEGDLIVPDGETLTIQPGVTVAFRGPWRILVNGCVNAEGTAEENIIFTHSNPTVLWDGFDYYNTPATNDASIFNYCTFEYGYAQRPEPLSSGGAFAIMDFDKLKFTNCIFQHNLADKPGATYDPTG
ncbi:MAG: hypothetical protein KAG99_10325, partial [Bacteroidales bacterium]|nr:hypothetical protein [Bacteroidales bacterium]